MRPPSGRILTNYVDLYHYTYPQDVDAAVVGDDSAYPTAFATGVRCSVQPEPPSRMTDQERVSGFTVWNVIFRSNPGVGVNDRIVWVDDAGVTRKLVVTLARNYAGRSSAWAARCEERT